MITSENSASSPTILLVDDNLDNIKILTNLLEINNYNICVANHGAAAFTSIDNCIPDLIVLDIMMPEIDGYEVCRRLKSNPKTQEVPVLFVSALTKLSDKIKAFECGAVDYITKPFAAMEVLVRVETQLQLKQSNEKLKQEIESRKLAEKREREKAVELERNLQELKKARSQLVQAEKMSSLGQFVAGVAHEINNPISFIYGNLYYARQYFQDLMTLLNLYRQSYYPPTQKIQQLETEIEIDFIEKDWGKLINSMESGAARIRQVVQSLRNFSRLGESGIKSANLEQGIEETLLILKHRFQAVGDRPQIEIIKNYGSISQVRCYGEQLNQVFMNLISNAIDSFEGYPIKYPIIQIETEVLAENWVAIRIIDNGCGIPEDVKDKIFDPFFTTKPVGKATGLGLSISHQIVTENHLGHLYCNSCVGKGTQFIIKIPMVEPQKKPLRKIEKDRVEKCLQPSLVELK